MNKQTASHCIRFRLAIESEKYLAYYKGIARDIVVRSEDNKNIKFPADAIRKFLTHEGIFGLFEIQFDENNKLIKISQVN
jgi:ribosomal protein L25 (general stress protein Ctc)